MSNHLAIATVTSVLGQAIGPAVGEAVSGAGITTQRPDAPNSAGQEARVNLYLYQVTPNPAWRNDDLPARGSGGEMVRRPQAALDLHYLLSFFGNEGELEPQRLLGGAVTALHARPVLTREAIRDVIRTATEADSDHYLAGSDLADQVELVRFSPLPLNLEELSKLWSVFFQTPYALSVAYQGSVVLLEADGSPQQAAPVRERGIHVAPISSPIIQEVLSRPDPNEPITAGQPILSIHDLVIHGQGLRSDDTRVLIGGLEADIEEESETRIIATIPPRVEAGERTVRVVHQTPRSRAESNEKTFVLRPHVTSVHRENVQGVGDEPRSADVILNLRPEVGRTQRVTLLLNERHPPEGRRPRSYSFEAPARTGSAAPETSAEIEIPVSGLTAGSYLVRVRVDGAESLLAPDSSGRYGTPEVEIP